MFKKTIALTMGALMLAPTLLGAQSSFAADVKPVTQDSKVSINVVSGGVQMETKDVDFGDIKIGDTIPGKEVKSILSIINRTGESQSVTVSDTGYDSHKNTIAYSFGDVPLTNSSMAIANYGSGFWDSPAKKDTTVNAAWGNTPKAAAISTTLTWVATPLATPNP